MHLYKAKRLFLREEILIQGMVIRSESNIFFDVIHSDGCPFNQFTFFCREFLKQDIFLLLQVFPDHLFAYSILGGNVFLMRDGIPLFHNLIVLRVSKLLENFFELFS